jgi:hypothetical protein
MTPYRSDMTAYCSEKAAYRQQIAALVYELYGLTPDEIALVEAAA